MPTAKPDRQVAMRVLRPNAPDRMTATTATGRHDFGRRVKRVTVLRVIYRGSGSCERVVSAKRSIVIS